MSKKALITGITGQDGAYLSRLLLQNGYEVYGTYRRTSSTNHWRMEELGIASDIRLVSMDMIEFNNILSVFDKIKPDEVYNLAAQSFVGVSFSQPIYTAEIDGLGTTRLLEALRIVNKNARFYQASTSEMFGKVQETPQTEKTPFYPRSPYAVAKLYAHWITVNYRESYNMHNSSGILFNHESPLRGEEFVTRKITLGLAKIKRGQQDCLELGNMDSMRDWGHAEDYVNGMYLMVQQPTPDDYILSTGESHSIREFIELASQYAGFDVVWEGSGVDTRGVDKKSGRTIVRTNTQYYRPAEVDYLIGDSSKARKTLGWKNKFSFSNLVEQMMKADMDRLAK